MQRLRGIVDFFNLLDSDGKLSITNLAVLVVLVKLCVAPSGNLADAGTLLMALANYAHKRWTINQQPDTPPADDKLAALQSKVDALVLQVGLRK